MVDQELVRRLLKELEAEKGCPVEIRVDTPRSLRYAGGQNVDGREYFGAFMDRPVEVKRVKGLGLKHLAARQFSGSHNSFAAVYRLVDEYNSRKQLKKGVYDAPFEITPEGIFAEPVPAGWGNAYHTKVADITLKLIE